MSARATHRGDPDPANAHVKRSLTRDETVRRQQGFTRAARGSRLPSLSTSRRGTQMLLARDGNEIRTVEEWYQYAKPRGGPHQWRDGYSAKELAKAWCRVPGQPAPPDEFVTLMASLPGIPGIHVAIGFPEHRIRLDGLPGEPRNADLALTCESLQGRVAISVEGKSRESFGDPVHQVVAGASSKFCDEIATNALVRLHGLAGGLFRTRRPGSPRLGELRYQLLTAAAGALISARDIQAIAAVLLVHEFRPPNIPEDRYADNTRDLLQFVHRLGGDPAVPGGWWGPFDVPGNDDIPVGIPLYVVKLISPCDEVQPLVPRRGA
jgi:hypothetical protein